MRGEEREGPTARRCAPGCVRRPFRLGGLCGGRPLRPSAQLRAIVSEPLDVKLHLDGMQRSRSSRAPPRGRAPSAVPMRRAVRSLRCGRSGVTHSPAPRNRRAAYTRGVYARRVRALGARPRVMAGRDCRPGAGGPLATRPRACVPQNRWPARGRSACTCTRLAPKGRFGCGNSRACECASVSAWRSSERVCRASE